MINIRRMLGTSAAATALLIAIPGTGWAHYVENHGVTATWNTFCAEIRTETSHGDGSGYSKVDTKSSSDNFYVSGFECTDPFVRPVGYLRSAFHIYKWNGASWALCLQTSTWYKNTDSAAKIEQKHVWPYVYCGTGAYFTRGEADVLDDGVWHGGDLNSPNHYLPPI